MEQWKKTKEISRIREILSNTVEVLHLIEQQTAQITFIN